MSQEYLYRDKQSPIYAHISSTGCYDEQIMQGQSANPQNVTENVINK